MLDFHEISTVLEGKAVFGYMCKERNDRKSLEPYKPYIFVITQDYVSDYTNDIRGRYRVIIDLIYNEDYNNPELLISDEFKIIY